MFENFWNRIITWFKDRSERSKLVRSFNESSRQAFINGEAPILLEASVSRGDPAYRHSWSRWLSSGFRIKVHTSFLLTSDDLRQIGFVIINNESLVRKLIVLGWDTLEVYVDKGSHGYKWNLKEHIKAIHQIGPL